MKILFFIQMWQCLPQGGRSQNWFCRIFCNHIEWWIQWNKKDLLNSKILCDSGAWSWKTKITIWKNIRVWYLEIKILPFSSIKNNSDFLLKCPYLKFGLLVIRLKNYKWYSKHDKSLLKINFEENQFNLDHSGKNFLAKVWFLKLRHMFELIKKKTKYFFLTYISSHEILRLT